MAMDQRSRAIVEGASGEVYGWGGATHGKDRIIWHFLFRMPRINSIITVGRLELSDLKSTVQIKSYRDATAFMNSTTATVLLQFGNSVHIDLSLSFFIRLSVCTIITLFTPWHCHIMLRWYVSYGKPLTRLRWLCQWPSQIINKTDTRFIIYIVQKFFGTFYR